MGTSGGVAPPPLLLVVFFLVDDIFISIVVIVIVDGGWADWERISNGGGGIGFFSVMHDRTKDESLMDLFDYWLSKLIMAAVSSRQQQGRMGNVVN